jgi:capsule synthesis protein PGA_cap
MSGRHRVGTGLRSSPTLITVLSILAAGAAGFIYRSEIADMLARSEGPETAPTPSTSPSPTPSRAPPPLPSPSPSPQRGRLVIHGTGDVSLDPGYIPNFRIHGYRYAWTGLKGLFRRDDLTVINLECAVSNLGAPVPKEFNFRCDPKALPVARKFGVEVANLANNHGGDYGKEALLDSRRNLREANIFPIGVGKNHRVAIKPAILEIDGWRVAVLGFGGVVPEPGWIAGPDHPGMADGDDIGKMVAAVKAADKIADLVFVTIHWGIELDTQPRQDDVERAHAMIRAGADGIFGHHSHRLNPLTHYRGRPIAWGLGNFVWPSHSAAGSTTAVAEFVVQPNGKVRGRLLGAHIEDSGHPVLTG